MDRDVPWTDDPSDLSVVLLVLLTLPHTIPLRDTAHIIVNPVIDMDRLCIRIRTALLFTSKLPVDNTTSIILDIAYHVHILLSRLLRYDETFPSAHKLQDGGQFWSYQASSICNASLKSQVRWLSTGPSTQLGARNERGLPEQSANAKREQ
jgi:hypothetical protein